MEKRGNKIFKYSSGGLISCCAKPASCCAEHLLVSMRWLGLHWLHNIMINFSPPILEHFCLLFVQIAQMGLILPRWGLILPRIPPPTLVLHSAVTHPFLGYVHTQNTPKTNLFETWNRKWVKWTTGWVIWTATWQNVTVWKVGKAFLEVGKKNYSAVEQLARTW